MKTESIHWLTGVVSAIASVVGPAEAGSPACCDSKVRINEIRVTHPGGTEAQEYFELRGDPLTPLECMHYIVLGPGGTVEEIVSLSGHVIGPNGVFLCAQPSFNPALFPTSPSPNLVSPLNFVNGGNRTHLICCSCDGLDGIQEGADLDPDNDGDLDVTPWSCVIDCIALVQTSGAPPVYCPSTRGPTTGGAQPPHVYRCLLSTGSPSPWRIGVFPLPGAGGLDSPGLPNPDCPPSMAFSGIAHAELGAATLTLIDDSTLLVSGLGVSPEDAMLAMAGPVDAFCLPFELPSELTAVDCLQSTEVIFESFGEGDAPTGALSLQCAGNGGISASVNAPGASTFRLRVFDDDDEVLVAEDLPPSEMVQIIVIEGPCPIPPCPIIIVDFGSIHGPDFGETEQEWSVGFRSMQDLTITVTLPGNITVVGNRVVFEADLQNPAPPIQAVSVRTEGIESLLVGNEVLIQSGLPHKALENGVMRGVDLGDGSLGIMMDGKLHLAPGIAFALQTAVNYRASTASGEVTGLVVETGFAEDDPTGSSLTFTDHLDVAGDPLVPGSITLSRTGRQQVLASFDLTGLDSVAVEPGFVLYYGSNGELLGSEPVAQYPVLFAGLPLIVQPFKKCGTLEDLPGPYMNWYYCLELPSAIPTPFGGTLKIVICRKILDIPIDREIPTPFVSRVEAVGGMTSFTILSEELVVDASPELCIADLDNDGTVGGGDLAVVLGDWNVQGGSTSIADLNGDGKVDGGDLATMLGSWGDCP